MMDVTVDVRQGESFLCAARYFRINLEAAHAETRKREEYVSASRVAKREDRKRKGGMMQIHSRTNFNLRCKFREKFCRLIFYRRLSFTLRIKLSPGFSLVSIALSSNEEKRNNPSLRWPSTNFDDPPLRMAKSTHNQLAGCYKLAY